ncbi:MAG: protein kinase domain-containing protein, partial [Actinomycetota bacterium]
MAADRIGTELAGYRIESVIGRGGMGMVYLAEHIRLSRRVALKVLPSEWVGDDRFRDRFVRESRLAASLDNPHIVDVYDAGEADGVLYLAMRYVQGKDLKSVIRDEGPLEIDRAVSVLAQIADALDSAHERGLVHRDVKSANVLIEPASGSRAEHAYLADFGLAKRPGSVSGLSNTGHFLGSVEYAAPEQLEGTTVDARSDVYSLGCVAYECLTGAVPYRRDSEAAVMFAQLRDPPPKVTVRRPELPVALDAVIGSALAKRPADRFPTAGALVGSLGAAARGEPVEISVPRPAILVVDDVPQNVRLLEAVLTSNGYEVRSASSGQEALELVAAEAPDLVLLDVQMPGMNGYEVCRRIRSDPSTRFLPVVMVTSNDAEVRVSAMEAEADDFVTKPFNQQELLARIRSLIRIKQYHDTIESQSAELFALNTNLEARVAEQVEELERLARLRRFLSPTLAELVLSQGDEILESHRREIAVLFADLRGWTAFSASTEPEEVMGVIREFHTAMGAIIGEFEATVGWFAGDGLMVWFNDPIPCSDPATRAVRMAVAMRETMSGLTSKWRKRGHELDFSVGIALGYATLGRIGFEGRYDYGAVGSVMNMASRLCDEAGPGQILVTDRVLAEVEELVTAEPAGAPLLKGFAKPVAAFRVLDVPVDAK